MKKWQMAAVGIVLLLAVAGVAVGALGPSFASPPRQAGPIVSVPATVVEFNQGWAPPVQQARPAQLPLAPTLPSATGPVLFSADFAAVNSSAWHSPLLPESDMQPLWRIADGVVQQAGDVNQETRLEPSFYLTGQPSWSNYVFEAAILATSGEDAGVVWNVQADGAGFYRLRLMPNLPNNAAKARLEVVQNGQVRVLGETAANAYAGYTAYEWQSVRVQSKDGRQQVWVNGSLLFDVADATLTGGQVGLFAWADSGTRFDNVRVQSAK